MFVKTGKPIQGWLRSILVMLLLGMMTPMVSGAEADPLPPSLKMVPDNAAFYGSTLRNGEQLEALLKSRAWARLTNLPAYKMAREKIESQMKMDPEWQNFQKMLAIPENQDLVKLLSTLFSTEFFMAGGNNWEKILQLLIELQGANNLGKIFEKIQAGGNPQGNNDAGLEMLKELIKHMDKLVIPDLVLGFQIPDSKMADVQLGRLEGHIHGFLQNAKLPVKPKFEKVTIGNGKFLSLVLDGSQIPWKELPWEKSDLDKEDAENLIAGLTKLKLSIRLGVTGNYLLLSLGGDPSQLLESIAGGTKKSLASLPEMEPVLKNANKKLISIGYLSQSFRSQGQTTAKDIDALSDQLKKGLEFTPIEDKFRKKLSKDGKEILDEVKKFLPEFGASVSYGFLNDKGQESFTIDYSKIPGRAQPAPLTLADYLGGKPILAGVLGGKSEFDSYDGLVKILKTIYNDLDEIAQEMIPAQQKEIYTQITGTVIPLFNRFDSINRNLITGLDGQVGLVIDGEWKSKKWLKLVDQPDVELPLPQIALILGIRDSDKFVRSFTDYRKLIMDTVGIIKGNIPNAAAIPDVKLPGPSTDKGDEGDLYYYSLPKEIGLDEQVIPTAGVGKKIAVLTFSQKTAQRFLKSRPMEAADLNIDSKKPLLAASQFDWPALIDLATPWVELSAKTIIAQNPELKDGKEVMDQIHEVLTIMKCFKGSSSTTTSEGGKLISHSISVVKDLDK